MPRPHPALRLLLAAALPAAALSAASLWDAPDRQAAWHDAASWRGAVPDAPGAEALFSYGLPGDITVQLDGEGRETTVGTIRIDTEGRTVTLQGEKPLVFSTGDRARPARLESGTRRAGLCIRAPMRIPDGARLDIDFAQEGDSPGITLAGPVSGRNITLANVGRPASPNTVSLLQGNAPSRFTGTIRAESATSRLNLGAVSIEETAAGDPFNPVHLAPGAQLSLARWNHGVLNPCRTLVTEPGKEPAMLNNGGEGQEGKHIPGPVVGDGALTLQGNYRLSGDNAFTGTLSVAAGSLWVDSPRSLGTGPLHLPNRDVVFGISGRDFTRLPAMTPLQLEESSNGSLTFLVQDPDATFTFDRSVRLWLNSHGASTFTKDGPGTLLFAEEPQRMRNSTGRALLARGGRIVFSEPLGGTVETDAGQASSFSLGFEGGTIEFVRSSGTNLFVGALIPGIGGGELILREARNAAGARPGPEILRFESVRPAPGAQTLQGAALSLRTVGHARFRTPVRNDYRTGIWGGARFTLNGNDWPVADEQGILQPYEDYHSLGAGPASPRDNALLSGVLTWEPGTRSTVHTLKIVPRTAEETALTLPPDGSLTLAANAILVSNEAAGEASGEVARATVAGGTLRLGQAGSDLIVHTAEGAALSLQSNVADENGGFFGLTKTGTGTLSMPRIPWTGRPVVVGGGTLELTGRDPLPYFVNTLDGVTATRETNVAVCARASLPVDFRPGAWLEIGACVLAIGGEPGAWELVLDRKPHRAVAMQSIPYTVRPALVLNGRLRLAQGGTLQNDIQVGGNNAVFDLADGQTNVLAGRISGGGLVLDNTAPEGTGILRILRPAQVGASLHVRRGTVDIAADALSQAGMTPVRFGEGKPAALRIPGGREVLLARLESANPAARIEPNAAGETLLGVLQGGDSVFRGTIADGPGAPVRLIKAGAGRLTLCGTQAYSGETAVRGGTLRVEGSLAASSNLRVEAHGTLEAAGTLPPVRIGRGGSLALGSAGGSTPALTLENRGALCYRPTPGQRPDGAQAFHVRGAVQLSGRLRIEGDAQDFAPGEHVLLRADEGLPQQKLSLDAPAALRSRLSLSVRDSCLILTVAP